MTVRELTEAFEREFPIEMAMEWDSPGLQVGRWDAQVKKVMIALDASDEVIEQCIREKADLLLTHHPLLMNGIRQCNDLTMPGRRILTMAENHLAHYAMHTNFDTAKMGELAAERMGLEQTEILEVTGRNGQGVYGIGRIGKLPEKMTAQECCRRIKKQFSLDHVRLFGTKGQEIVTAAISPGSGKSMIPSALQAGAEILITGDIGHHDGMDAVQQGLMVVDAGHYGIEHIFKEYMKAWMRKMFPELETEKAQEHPPFQIL